MTTRILLVDGQMRKRFALTIPDEVLKGAISYQGVIYLRIAATNTFRELPSHLDLTAEIEDRAAILQNQIAIKEHQLDGRPLFPFHRLPDVDKDARRSAVRKALEWQEFETDDNKPTTD